MGDSCSKGEEATAIFDSVARTVREEWRTRMQSAGVSERDCEAIKNAFVHEGLFYEMGIDTISV